MEQNPFEQQNKINTEKEQLKKDLGRIFDEKKKGELIAKVNAIVSLLELFEKNGILFNKEEIIKNLQEAAKTEDREIFVLKISKILEPIVILKVTQPKVFSKIQRESLVDNLKDKIRLSEFLYYGISGDKKNAHIHLLHAKDFMTKEKIEDFQKDIEAGFSKLAEIVKKDKDIEKITATSWIVALRGSAKRLEKMGFTIVGPISKEEREKHFDNEKRLIAEAFISREDFLVRYGKKEN